MFRGVTEYAEVHGFSARRVLQLIEDGRIKAHRTGGIWLIDDQSEELKLFSCRPLGQRMTAGLIAALSGSAPPATLSAGELIRLTHYLDRLHESKQPDELLRSWLRTRAKRLTFEITPKHLDKLRCDNRIALSGVSDVRVTKSPTKIVEGYVAHKSIRALKSKYELVESDNGKVIFHVTRFMIPNPVPLGLTLADLAEHRSPSQLSILSKLLQQADTASGSWQGGTRIA